VSRVVRNGAPKLQGSQRARAPSLVGGSGIVQIAFVLPGLPNRPVGGYAVVYEYANQLVARGHVVRIEHVSYLGGRPALRGLADTASRRLTRRRPSVRWFAMNDAVELNERLWWSRRIGSNANIVVATTWRTAEHLGRVRGLHGRPYYLIQSYETWSGPTARIDATWGLPFHRIVIAGWMVALAKQLGALPVQHIPNAVDVEAFTMTAAPETRSADQVAMMWHDDPIKGSRDGVAALRLVHEARPSLQVTMFSAHRPPPMPPWIHVVHKANRVQLQEIYNRAAVFISPSHIEGWPLPPSEAMACGAALLSTDIPGVGDYAADGESAVLVPVGDPQAMAQALLSLLADEPRRVRIARHGHELITGSFSWATSTDRLESAFSAG